MSSIVRSIPKSIHYPFKEKLSNYCLIIPVLNEGARITAQLQRLKPWMHLVDVVIVDGGSTDGATTTESLVSSGIRALIVKSGPGGLSAQLRLGIAYLLDEGYAGAILMDGNNKDNPEAIDRFIDRLDQGYDHIQGSRFVSQGRMVNNPLSRILAIRLIHAPLISLAAGFRYTDTTNGFRAYSRRFLMDSRVQPLRDVFQKYELHYYLAIRAAKCGFRVTEIPVERSYPSSGPIPSKIKGTRGHLRIIGTLLRTCLGAYNPRENK